MEPYFTLISGRLIAKNSANKTLCYVSFALELHSHCSVHICHVDDGLLGSNAVWTLDRESVLKEHSAFIFSYH
jgi:hypothetical protein